MAAYLERYLNGEHEEVWAELVVLGDQVRQKPLLTNAQAVARETMTRARSNIKRIHKRLQDLGYHFEFPKRALVRPPADIVARLDDFERQVGAIPLALRAWCEVVGEVNFMGTYPMLSYYAPSVTSGFLNLLNPSIFESEQWQAKAAQHGLPEISSVFLDFMKQRVQTDKQRPSFKLGRDAEVTADPLVVEPLEMLSRAWYESWLEDCEDLGDEAGDFRITIAPDISTNPTSATTAATTSYCPTRRQMHRC